MTKLPIIPFLERHKGWQMDITSIKNSESLPEEMKQYIHFINEYLGVPITYISNGPEREQIIKA
jgi:adenylosuccinate synthase